MKHVERHARYPVHAGFFWTTETRFSPLRSFSRTWKTTVQLPLQLAYNLRVRYSARALILTDNLRLLVYGGSELLLRPLFCSAGLHYSFAEGFA